MHSSSSSSMGKLKVQMPTKGQPLLPTHDFGSELFNQLHHTSKRHDGKASRLFSRNYLRQDFARLYHNVKNGKLAQDEKLKAVNEVFSFFNKENMSNRERVASERQVQENLRLLSTALSDGTFKADGSPIATINKAVVQFSQFLYEPGKKTPQDISDKTQAIFKSLFELVQGEEERQNAGTNLCEMIDSATVLANMEMLLPSDREEAINKFTAAAQKFIDAIFNGIKSNVIFDDAKFIFKDAVYLAVVNAGLLMCYEQKSGLDKFRLLVKRSFVPFAYICTKAEGIAAGFLTTKIGAAMGSAISGALASTVGKVGIGALAIKFSVPIIFFVGSGALGLAITYGLYKLSEKSSNDLKKNLNGKIKDKQSKLKSSFGLSNEETEAAEVTKDPFLTAIKSKHGDTGTLTETEKAHNSTVNQVRTGNKPLSEMQSEFDIASLKSKGIFNTQGRVSKDDYKEIKVEYDRLTKAFNVHYNSKSSTEYTRTNQCFPLWHEALTAYTDALDDIASISKSQKAKAVQNALKNFIDSIAGVSESNETEQKSKIGQLLALFHQYINESDRYTIADLSKRAEDLYKLAGGIAQAAIGTTVSNDEGESTERKDLVAYLQFHIYNAGFAISANHRSFPDKSKRYASILIAPACNSLLKVETMGVAAVSQMLVEPHITNSILQVGIDSFASVVLGVPFVALGIVFGAWTLVKADKADAKGIKTLNPMVRDYVEQYLRFEENRLKADQDNETKGFIEKLISERELKKVEDMLNQIAAARYEEWKQ